MEVDLKKELEEKSIGMALNAESPTMSNVGYIDVEDNDSTVVEIDADSGTSMDHGVPMMEDKIPDQKILDYPGQKIHEYRGPNPKKKVLSSAEKKKKRKQQQKSRKRNRR